MNLNYRDLLPEDFSPSSRVWIYQSNRLFSMSEALTIEDMINHFVAQWNSHGDPVKGFGTLFFGQFIILMADESATGVSGCSTDSSVRLVKDIEKAFNVNLFDRQLLAFVIKEKIQLLPLNQLNYAVQNGFISSETLYFNNTVLDKKELLEKWIIPVRESWLARKLPQAV
ncbi:MAG TPA: hypothetical protein VK166_08990 [Chitinophagaceae bacterium]|nr:hypothetical protein [Chitinophagaceae bacterium]